MLRPGEAWVPGGPDFPVGPGTRVSWTALSPGAPAGLRIRSGRAILAEERIDGEPRGGTLDGGALLPGPVRVECEAGAAIPVVFAASVHADPAAVPAAPHGDGLALSRDLPGRARAGQVTEIALEVRSPAALEAPVAIRCPLPRGAVPAEDGWTLRGRAPPGTRVEVEEDAVAWRLPSLPAGTTRLAVRVRFAWRGRYGVPPATAAGEDPLLPRARSAGASVVVE